MMPHLLAPPNSKHEAPASTGKFSFNSTYDTVSDLTVLMTRFPFAEEQCLRLYALSIVPGIFYSGGRFVILRIFPSTVRIEPFELWGELETGPSPFPQHTVV